MTGNHPNVRSALSAMFPFVKITKPDEVGKVQIPSPADFVGTDLDPADQFPWYSVVMIETISTLATILGHDFPVIEISLNEKGVVALRPKVKGLLVFDTNADTPESTPTLVGHLAPGLASWIKFVGENADSCEHLLSSMMRYANQRFSALSDGKITSYQNLVQAVSRKMILDAERQLIVILVNRAEREQVDIPWYVYSSLETIRPELDKALNKIYRSLSLFAPAPLKAWIYDPMYPAPSPEAPGDDPEGEAQPEQQMTEKPSPRPRRMKASRKEEEPGG